VCYETGKTQVDRPINAPLCDGTGEALDLSYRARNARIGTDCTHSSRSDRTAGGWGRGGARDADAGTRLAGAVYD